MIRPEKVGMYEELADRYSKGLWEARASRASLDAFLDEWRAMAPDAAAVVSAEGFDFDGFVSALESERRGKFSGEAAAEKYGPLLLPENLLECSMVAVQYGVPEGVALRRLIESGRLQIVDGVLRRAVHP